MLMRIFLSTILMAIALVGKAFAANVNQYLPTEHVYNDDIVKPEDILGFGIGERHIRHDQLLQYLTTLAQQSDRMMITEIGRTVEYRKQVLLTISSAENLAKLPQLLSRSYVDSSSALVVWLGYSVHGDEISGSNAALAVAYHLAASQDINVQNMLKDVVIVIEPSINPDGMDRFVNWVSTHRGVTPNDDPNHIEHHQGWRTGRTNHFGFDLNRDWLLLTQKESQNRLRYFHQYQPHVLGDFHEMGANSSYFFQPGIPTRTHPYTPNENIKLTQLLATYHAKALDQDNRLYYSEESFDDFYYGKGSTYPDINASVGILFEQASSRGFQQQTINGLLTFEYGIKNHVLTSLSTLTGAWENQQQLKKYRQSFYQQTQKLAKDAGFDGYLITESYDQSRLNAFIDKLQQHQIKVYPLAEDFRHNGKIYSKSNSVYIPLEQRQFRVIQALFNQEKEFRDNTFYDVSGWTLPLAMNIEFHQVKRTWGLELSSEPWQKTSTTQAVELEQAYAYVFEWHDFYAPKMLHYLLDNGIKAKVATKAFTAKIGNNNKQFSTGTILIPAAIQTEQKWLATLQQALRQNSIEVYPVSSGLTSKGIDFGSNSFKPLEPIKVLLLGGAHASQYEAAEILYYLDQLLAIPVTVVEQDRLSSITLSDYSHIVMVDGKYEDLNNDLVKQLETWVKQGGVMFSQKRASEWLAAKSLLKASFINKDDINELFSTDGLSYGDKEKLAARKRIAGAIYQSKLDLSHPLTYGMTTAELPVFRNSTLIMEKNKQPFVSVATYSPEPLLSGYSDQTLVNRIARNDAIVAHNLGKGRVIATSDVLMFRGYWYGSAKIIANSLFFAKAFSASTK
ncbi:M14 family zinc carboxypeptidase [Thalassotalea ganghwensis]